MSFSAPTATKRLEFMNAGVDWLTVTCMHPSSKSRLKLEFDRLDLLYQKQGHNKDRWSFRGYNGWKIGSTRWGSRADSDIGMMSGEDACLNWLPFANQANNVTRLDLAVTCHMGQNFPKLASKIYNWLCDNRDLVRSSQRQYSLIVNSKGGETLYIGSRASDQYARVYDKGKEQDPDNDPGKIWRYEVEFKGKRAKTVLERLIQQAALDDVEQAVSATVFMWFRAREVEPIWSLKGTPIKMDLAATVTSDELKLLWLHKQVRPSIRQLIEHGKLEDVMQVLGLDKENLYGRPDLQS